MYDLQNAPLTEQEQTAIVSLSHAVAERPMPAKLVWLCATARMLFFVWNTCNSDGNVTTFYVNIIWEFIYRP